MLIIGIIDTQKWYHQMTAFWLEIELKYKEITFSSEEKFRIHF